MQFSELKVLNVFLASPGDLTDERKIARAVVDEVNLTARLLGWRIELLGWEDSIPGYTRPQAKINAQVNLANLFVGMLYRRWGQPPGVGEYRSGFEEEFALAVGRREKGPEPEIWMFLKEIEPEFLRDPGEQLQVVLEFRAKLEREKKVFYGSFRTTGDWEKLFRTHLNQFLISTATAASNVGVPAQTGSQPSQAADEANSGASRAPNSAPPPIAGITSFFSRLSTAIEHGALSDEQDTHIDPADVARLSILSAAFFAEQSSDELLTTHAANLLYKHRRNITRLLPREWLLVIRTVIADKHDVTPGWSYVTSKSALVSKFLFGRAMYDNLADVSAGALRIARNLSLKQSSSRNRALLTRIIERADDNLTKDACGWLARSGTKADLWFLEEVQRNAKSNLPSAAEVAVCSILSRADPKSLFERLLHVPTTLPESLVEVGIKAAEGPELKMALAAPNETVRRMSANYLQSKGELSLPEIELLKRDGSPIVKEVGYRAAINGGEIFPPGDIRAAFPNSSAGLLMFSSGVDPDHLILLAFSKKPYDELHQLLDWYSLDGNLAYKALALYHFERFSSKLRGDLGHGFEQFRDSERKRFLALYQNTALEKQFADLDDYKRDLFLEAALSGIVEHGSKDDRLLVQQFASSKDSKVSTKVGDFLGKFGNDADVVQILSIAEQKWGPDRHRLINAAYELSDSPEKLARSTSLSADIRARLLAILSPREFQAIRDSWLDLLADANAAVRKEAVFQIIKSTTVSERRKILEDYLSRSAYYYNVVCWLDRLIYMPRLWHKELAKAMDSSFDL